MKQLASYGIVLRRLDYGEADRIITMLTKDFGKVRAMAKGVRKQRSKLAGGIELFSVSEVHLIKGKGDIDTLVSTRLVTHYGGIVTDLDRTTVGYHFLQVIDKAVEDHVGNEYFPVLNESLAALNTLSLPLIVSDLSFMMRMLEALGHMPQFGVDTAGNKAVGERFEFDFESVSFVEKSDGPFTRNHIKLLKLLAFNPPQAVKTVQGVAEYCQELSPLVRGLFRQYVPGAY